MKRRLEVRRRHIGLCGVVGHGGCRALCEIGRIHWLEARVGGGGGVDDLLLALEFSGEDIAYLLGEVEGVGVHGVGVGVVDK